MPPSWAANAILHPQRRPMTRQPDRPFDAVEFDGAGVKLKGWWFHAGEKRGTLVYLHGVSDNRGTSVGIADHFLARGFDVVAYDSRAHGESGGDACTYGVLREAGPRARPRSRRGAADRPDGDVDGRGDRVAGGGGRPAGRRRRRGVAVLRSAHGRDRAGAVLREQGATSPRRSGSRRRRASFASTTSARWRPPPRSPRRRW